MELSQLIPTLRISIILIATLFSSLSHPVNGILTESEHPICVVGAGVSGLNVAALLEEKGYYVEVFEKEPQVGGKIKTFRIPREIQMELCAVVHTFTNSHFLRRKLEQLDLTTSIFPKDQVAFNPQTGQVLPKPNLTSGQLIALDKAVKSYGYYRDVVYKKDMNSFGHLEASPELFVPMSTWLRAMGLEAIKPIFILFITVEGYGHLDDVPALYCLKFVDGNSVAGVANEMPGLFFTVNEGLDVLAERMASSLSSVKVNKEVVRVERRGENKVIWFKNDEKKTCSQVIFAFPPLLPKLQKIIPDLSETERAILDQVKISKYISAANYIPPLNSTLYGDPNPEGAGGVNGFIKQSYLSRSNVYSSYSWIRGDFNRTATPEELLDMEKQLKATIGRISNNQGKTYLVRSTEYFPHVNTAALEAGFYKDFNSLQGVDGIYYATTLSEFEILEGALRMSEGLVKRFF